MELCVDIKNKFKNMKHLKNFDDFLIVEKITHDDGSKTITFDDNTIKNQFIRTMRNWGHSNKHFKEEGTKIVFLDADSYRKALAHLKNWKPKDLIKK